MFYRSHFLLFLKNGENVSDAPCTDHVETEAYPSFHRLSRSSAKFMLNNEAISYFVTTFKDVGMQDNISYTTYKTSYESTRVQRRHSKLVKIIKLTRN